MILIKNFTEPTNVYIVGEDFKNLPETFSITDDYHSCAISNGFEKRYIDTDGFVFIYSEEEFNNNKHLIEYPSQEYVLLKNFVGEIHVKVVDSDSNNILKKDVNLKDYLMYQTEEDTDFDDVVIVLPLSTELPQAQSLEELLEN